MVRKIRSLHCESNGVVHGPSKWASALQVIRDTPKGIWTNAVQLKLNSQIQWKQRNSYWFNKIYTKIKSLIFMKAVKKRIEIEGLKIERPWA